MNGEPKLMKMQNYSNKKLKDGMTKESKSMSLKSENMFFCTTLVSDSLQEKSSQNGKAPMLSRRFIGLEPSKWEGPYAEGCQWATNKALYFRYAH